MEVDPPSPASGASSRLARGEKCSLAREANQALGRYGEEHLQEAKDPKVCPHPRL